MTNQERLAAMEAFVERIGVKPEECGFHLHSITASVTLYGDQMSAQAREALVAEMGAPTRPKGSTCATFSKKDSAPNYVTVYSWPWTTCGECGHEINSPVIA